MDLYTVFRVDTAKSSWLFGLVALILVHECPLQLLLEQDVSGGLLDLGRGFLGGVETINFVQQRKIVEEEPDEFID